MAGGEHPPQPLRAGLLSDAHGQVVFTVRDGVVRAANKVAIRLLGAGAIGRPVSELFDAASVAKIRRITASGSAAAATELQLVAGSGPPQAMRCAVVAAGDYEFCFIAQPPGVFYPEEFGARLMAANEETTRLLRELSRDMRSARMARDSLQQIGGLRDLFIAALAHDIRAPLNAILLTEAVLRKTAGTVQPHDLERHAMQVERSARSIVELVDTVLLAARLDSPDSHLTRQMLQLDEIVLEWVETLTPVANQAEIGLDVSLRATPKVDGDRVRLGEVVSNLLTNAIRHCPRHGLVHVEIATVDGRAVCTVTDAGPGVPQEMRETIFEKFTQGASARGTTGLGLYIARRIIELHGGRIWVEDNQPSGARFVFDLPLAPVSAAAGVSA